MTLANDGPRPRAVGPIAEPPGPAHLVPGRLGWYLRRLASMSPVEIAYRVEGQIKREVSRLYQPHFDDVMVTGRCRPLPGLPELRAAVIDLARNDTLTAQWADAVERVRAGRYRLLGRDWPAGSGDGRWFLDPVSGRCWPTDRYCFAIDHRHDRGLGDVKYVWELNRLQHLHAVAALAAATGKIELSHLCVGEVASWIRANPPFRGINWASGIELALRVVSLLVVFGLIDPVAASPAFRGRLHACLAAHGYWLYRYPSRHSSANNHLIAEAGGLYLLGALVPDLPGAGEWRRYGRATLEAEALRQIHPDGIGAEQSPTYTAFTLEWLLLAQYAAILQGDPLSGPVLDRMTAAADALGWLLDAGGQPPRIGDDDEGRVIVSHPEQEGYVASVVAGIAGMAGRPDLAPAVRHPHLRDALFRPCPAAAPPRQGMRHFPEGGLTVVREDVCGRSLLLAFDHGPLGYLSIAAHGHADALAVWLHLDDQPVLVDAGTYLYHGGGAWRNRLRGTRMHNTLCLAGADSSTIAGPFNWSSKARATVVHANHHPDKWSVMARHDGYGTRFGVDHRRTVRRAGPGRIEIHDRLEGVGPARPVEIGFLLHPSLDVRESGGLWTVGRAGQPLLTLRHHGRLVGRCARSAGMPDDAPGDGGWYSARFGFLEPTTRLVFAGPLGPGQECSFSISIVPRPEP